jgi:ADP-ribose pyrophosphatase YjhB (NUDIX family)
MPRLPYFGAGVLIACRSDRGWRLLLFERAIRPARGTWSIVGGRRETGESFFDAACREASEEAFGGMPLQQFLRAYRDQEFSPATARSHLLYHVPFVAGWRTFLCELDREFPVAALRLNYENRRAAWFDAANLPKPLHLGVRRSMRKFDLHPK